MRRIALDSETLALLRGHRDRVRARTAEVKAELTGQTFVSASVRCPDHGEPYSPHAVSSRDKEMAQRLSIQTHLHALRHFSGLSPVAARSRRRGATTLRVYAAWWRHRIGRRPNCSEPGFPVGVSPALPRRRALRV
jgi:hypothetical protein